MRKIFLLLFLLFCISGVFALGIQNPDLPKLDKKNIETTSGGTTNNYYINGSSNETNLAHTNQSNNYTEAGDWYWYMDNGAIIFYTSDGFYSVGYGGDSGAGYLGLGDWGVVYNNGRFYIVGDYNYYFNFTALTDNREYIWQDKDGTIALTSDIVNYTFNETNLAHTNQSNDMHYNFIKNISYLTWGGASGDEWDFGKTDSNEIRTKDGSISFNGDTYKCYFSTAYGQVWCGANPYAFEVGGNVKFDKNVTIGEKLCDATACFTLTELNTSSSSSSGTTWADLAGVYDTYSYDKAIAYSYWDGSHLQMNQDTKLTWTGDTLSINGNILLPSSGLPTFSGATTDSYNDGIDSQIDFSSGLATAISTAYDESLMKDITYLNRVVNPENVLVPIKFKWSAQGIKQFGDNRTKENYQIGYKAQDVEKFYPDCIVNTYLKQMEGKEQVKTTTPVKTYNKDCLYAYIYAGGLK